MSFYRKRWYDYVLDALGYASLIEAGALLLLLLAAAGLLLYWMVS